MSRRGQYHSRDIDAKKLYKFVKQCPYCGGSVSIQNASVVYGERYRHKSEPMWVCDNFPDCDSFVGCHPHTNIPLGRMANEKLRKTRVVAHKHFDPLWKSGYMTRKNAYLWLAVQLEIPQKDCHIGMFSLGRCREAIRVCKRVSAPKVVEYKEQNRRPMFKRGFNNY